MHLLLDFSFCEVVVVDVGPFYSGPNVVFKVAVLILVLGQTQFVGSKFGFFGGFELVRSSALVDKTGFGRVRSSGFLDLTLNLSHF